MVPVLQMSLLALFALLSWSRQLFWFLFKVLLTLGIGWGIFLSLDPFPIEAISRWQLEMQTASLGVPGEQFFLWIAKNWLPIGATIVLIVTVRSRRILRDVGPTSHHAAFAASALANYLDVEPTTKGFLTADRKGTLSFGTIFKESLVKHITAVLQGVPFLPDDAIPGRNGEVVRYRDDLMRYLEDTQPRATHGNQD